MGDPRPGDITLNGDVVLAYPDIGYKPIEGNDDVSAVSRGPYDEHVVVIHADGTTTQLVPGVAEEVTLPSGTVVASH
jgi:hypothetical protein